MGVDMASLPYTNGVGRLRRPRGPGMCEWSCTRRRSRAYRTTNPTGSSQVAPRHPRVFAYRCFLPDL